MHRFPLRAALAAAALAAPAAAWAQAAAPAAAPAAAAARAPIIVIDIDRVVLQSAAGKFAASQLRPQGESLGQLVRTRRDQFAKEEQALQQGVQNKSITPEVAQQRARDLQQRAATAQTEVDNRQRQLQANQQFVLKQINDAVTPIVSALLRERGAIAALPRGATLQHAQSVDVTADAIARLDKALPRVNVNAPAPAAPANAVRPSATPPR